jgi:hypothetical protein
MSELGTSKMSNMKPTNLLLKIGDEHYRVFEDADGKLYTEAPTKPSRG